MAEVKALRPASEADALEIIRRAGSVESVTALVAMLGWERTKTQRWLARRQRTGDIVGNKREERPPMKWDHVDLNSRVWTIPATKTDAEHRVPLSDAAL